MRLLALFRNIFAIRQYTFLFFLFSSCTSFSSPTQANFDCLETVQKIKSAQNLNFVPTPEKAFNTLNPLIQILESQEKTLTDSCKYWLASAYQWRSNFAYAKMGLPNLGLEDCLNALAIFEQMNGNYQKEKAYLHNSIGIYYQNIFDFDQALLHLEKAANIFQELSQINPIFERDLNNAVAALGITYYKVGEIDKCEKYTNQALEARLAFKKSPYASLFEDIIISNSYYGKALLFQLKAEKVEKGSTLYYEHYDSALHYMDTCIYMIEKNIFFTAYAENNRSTLIKLYMSQCQWINEVYPNKIGKAEELLKKAANYFSDAYPEDIGYGNIIRGNIRLNENKFDDALRLYQIAFKRLVKGFENQHDNPILYLDQIIDKVFLLEGLNQKAITLEKRFMAQGDSIDLKNSLKTFELAIDLIDSLQFGLPYNFSVESIQEKYSSTYEKAILVSFRLYEQSKNFQYIKTAFRIAEKSKSFSLKRELNKKILLSQLAPDSKEWKILTEEEFLLKKISGFEKRYLRALSKESLEVTFLHDSLLTYKKQYFMLQDEIEKNYPTLYKDQFNQKVVSLEEVQHQLDEQTAYIQYVTTPEDLFIFILTNKQKTTRLIKTKGIKNWEASLDSCLVGLANTNDILYRESAHKLYKALLSDALASLPSTPIKNLVIIPDGRLRNLPFEVLVDDEFVNKRYDQLSYVFRKYLISYDFSITTHLQSKSKPEAKNIAYNYCGFVAAYGDDGGKYRRCSNTKLIGALETLNNTQQIFKKSKLNKKTTKQDFLRDAPKGKLLYIGVHGCLDERDPILSNILFTETQDSSNADLTIGEIYSLNLHADHTIITACYAGSGRLKKGEGLMSIARAFYYAGSKSMMTALWEVRDIAATDIEVDYLKYLNEKNMTKAKALQKAKLDFLKSKPRHPSFWANFILIGNTSPIQFE